MKHRFYSRKDIELWLEQKPSEREMKACVAQLVSVDDIPALTLLSEVLHSSQLGISNEIIIEIARAADAIELLVSFGYHSYRRGYFKAACEYLDADDRELLPISVGHMLFLEGDWQKGQEYCSFFNEDVPADSWTDCGLLNLKIGHYGAAKYCYRQAKCEIPVALLGRCAMTGLMRSIDLGNGLDVNECLKLANDQKAYEYCADICLHYQFMSDARRMYSAAGIEFSFEKHILPIVARKLLNGHVVVANRFLTEAGRPLPKDVMDAVCALSKDSES